jgi:transcriptional regulator with XRE-family HTH domain
MRGGVSLAITKHVGARRTGTFGKDSSTNGRRAESRLARAMSTEPFDDAEPRASEFGRILRHWRHVRAISQIELAGRAGVSPRHLSFLETGRCGPSRGAVLQLGRALELPRAETERLLLVAGYAGDWTRAAGDADSVRAQLGEIAHLLEAHDPLPAVISAPNWSIAYHNRSAAAFFVRIREVAPALRSEPLDLRELLTEQNLGRVVPNLAELLEHVHAGLYQLAPDPASFGHAPTLLHALPRSDAPGQAIARSGCGRIWEEQLRVRDLGVEFALKLFTVPFAGPASGFALVLTRPVDAASEATSRRYFRGLLQRAH